MGEASDEYDSEDEESKQDDERPAVIDALEFGKLVRSSDNDDNLTKTAKESGLTIDVEAC